MRYNSKYFDENPEGAKKLSLSHENSYGSYSSSNKNSWRDNSANSEDPSSLKPHNSYLRTENHSGNTSNNLDNQQDTFYTTSNGSPVNGHNTHVGQMHNSTFSSPHDEEIIGQNDIGNSFWDIGHYKRTVRRIEDGYKLCSDYCAMMQERCSVEEAYAKSMKAWAKKWAERIEKGPEYGTMQSAWLFSASEEGERLAEVHLAIRDNLGSQVLKTLKDWQKENFHKTVVPINHIKESKEMEELFRKTQKPWAKLYKRVSELKKAYHLACKYEKTALVQESNSRADTTKSPEEQKRLRDKVEKCREEVTKTRDRYESALVELNAYNPKYMEDMKQVFEKCQRMEEYRMSFFKQILFHVQQSLNLTRYDDISKIYDDYRQSIDQVDIPRDLSLFSNTYGTGTAMNWPIFEEYSPQLHSISRRGLLKAASASTAQASSAGDGGVTLKSIVQKDLPANPQFVTPSPISATLHNGPPFSCNSRDRSNPSFDANSSPRYSARYEKCGVKMRPKMPSSSSNASKSSGRVLKESYYQEPSTMYRSYGNLAEPNLNSYAKSEVRRSHAALDYKPDRDGDKNTHTTQKVSPPPPSRHRSSFNNNNRGERERENQVKNYKEYHQSHYAVAEPSRKGSFEASDIKNNEWRKENTNNPNNVTAAAPIDRDDESFEVKRGYFEAVQQNDRDNRNSKHSLPGLNNQRVSVESSLPQRGNNKERSSYSNNSSTSITRQSSNRGGTSNDGGGLYTSTSRISLSSPRGVDDYEMDSSSTNGSKEYASSSLKKLPVAAPSATTDKGSVDKPRAATTTQPLVTASTKPSHLAGVRCVALYDYEAQEEDEISFKTGDTIIQLAGKDEQGWAQGKLENGRVGLYPAEYVNIAE